MFVEIGNTLYNEHKIGVDKAGNEFIKLKFRRQYYGEIRCSHCGNDLQAGYYWLNIGSCTPYCVECIKEC